MGVVFLIIRFARGGYFIWHGAQHLNASGREHLLAYARSRSVPRNMTLAFATVASLPMPRLWPLTLVR